MWQVGLCVLVNALLMLAPAAVRSAGSLLQVEILLAVFLLSVAAGLEVLVQSPNRVLTQFRASADLHAASFNTFHGCLLLLSLQLTFVFAACDGRASGWPNMVVGSIVVGVATALRLLAIWHLGSAFGDGFEPATNSLLRSGIYSVLRHPAELGLLALPIGVGITLAVDSIFLILWMPVALVSFIRIWKEERGSAGRLPHRSLVPSRHCISRQPCRNSLFCV